MSEFVAFKNENEGRCLTRTTKYRHLVAYMALFESLLLDSARSEVGAVESTNRIVQTSMCTNVGLLNLG
jgi:hypothetical protein